MLTWDFRTHGAGRGAPTPRRQLAAHPAVLGNEGAAAAGPSRDAAGANASCKHESRNPASSGAAGPGRAASLERQFAPGRSAGDAPDRVSPALPGASEKPAEPVESTGAMFGMDKWPSS
jgi:hypothetical protein